MAKRKSWLRGPGNLGPAEKTIMFTRILQMLLFLLVSALANIAAAQEHSLQTIDDVSAFMQTYCRQPRQELIASLIDALHSTGFVHKSTVAVVIGFFSEVFAANPNRLPNWQVVMAKQDEQTRAVLDRALAVSKAGGVLNIGGHSADLNDEYWGAFFATANPKFIDRLIDQLRYVDERDDMNLFGAGGSAKWSLAGNAQTQPEVRLAIETARLKADKRTQELITELLALGPERVKQELTEIVRKQRSSGKWTVAPPPIPLVDAELSRLIHLTPESTRRISANVADGRTEASRCAHATLLASTYSSRVLYKVTNGEATDIQWRVDFSAPDKYHVLQSSGQAFDEWITIGKENYRNAGQWVKLVTGEPELNRFFAVDKFLHILATAEPSSAIEYISQETRYLLFVYHAQLGPDFTFISKTATEPSEVRIWIDRETHLLVKGEVRARANAHGTLSKLDLQQVFSGYGDAIRIEPPPSFMMGTNKK